MTRTKGAINKRKFTVLAQYAEIAKSFERSTLDVLYECAMTGNLPNRGRKKVSMSEQLSALKEVTAYGFSKQATLQVIGPKDTTPVQISFDMFGSEVIADPDIEQLIIDQDE